jgi:ribosomal protein S12 methylthiotransferase accessory factor
VNSLETRGFFSPYLDRTRSPAETVALMRPRFFDFGITRLARVTGLDCIGIPVWSAIRPNSRTLSVSQGKGISDDAAAASAVMEAIEVATAERLDLPHRTCSADALAAEGRSVALFDGLLRAGAASPDRAEIIDWIEGYDLLRGMAVWVPLDVVVLSEGGAPSRYWQSTDGLASGNILWEAVFHGLCERVERDSLALWALREDAWIAAHCLDPCELDDCELGKLIAKIEGAGLQTRLFDIASDVGVPVYFATISPVPSGQESNWTYFDLSSGSGCHPDRARAAIRAVTEAAQTRLTTISAVRDDFDPSKYRAALNADLLPYIRVSPKRAATNDAPARLDPTAYIDFMVERLRAVGVRSAVVVPLEGGEAGYAVAKALVPDLETLAGDRRFARGKRALRAMLARA